MSVISGANAVAGAGGAAAYEIERSLRVNSADSAYLNRTFPSVGNLRTWTYSAWVKKTQVSISAGGLSLFYAGSTTSSPRGGIVFGNAGDNKLSVYGMLYNSTTTVLGLETSAEYRDPSSWYHIVVALDTTQATASNRCKIYVNGVQVTSFGTATYPSQNDQLQYNDNILHATRHPSGNYLWDGYLAEVNFVDGQQLTASDFGEFNADTGVWQPIAYSGSYGTNGFYLNFSDNSGTTSTTLGKDYSGNGNNWTPNNFSVTAGAGNDSLVDTPTSYGTDTGVGGEVRGNYCTLNPLNVTNAPTLSNGNLDFAGSTSNASATAGTIGISSGKWYWEVLVTNTSALGIGIFNATVAPSLSTIYDYENDGRKRTGGVASSYGASFTTNDIIGVALDLDGGTLVFYKNNTSQGTAFSGLAGTLFVAGILDVDNVPSATCSINFGQRPFAYTAPSGYKALCTQNLPNPTIADGSQYMDALLYTGNGSTQSISGLSFQPDWVWIKRRSAASDHELFDVLRGATKDLFSNTTDAETTISNSLTSFDSDGFTTGANGGTNSSGGSFVAWNWKAGGSGVSNTDGSITSTVSANPTAGFSIVTYTGTGANATVGHGLGVAPSFIITKHRNAADGWYCYHASLGNNAYIQLSSTAARVTPASTYWQTTTPSSTVFSIGTSNSVNQNTINFVAYCFAPVEGYSAFGSYVGNGNDDGTFVYTGFKPAFVLIKCSSTSSTYTSWSMFDTSRSSYNVSAGNTLYANSSINEGYRGNGSTASTTSPAIDLLSNGFKLRKNADETNASQTYIYAAFAENPFKYSLAR